MSTRRSEDVAPGDTDDEATCFLTSGDDAFWSEPRACRPLCRIAGPDPTRGLLLIEIDPPAVGQRFGRGGDDFRPGDFRAVGWGILVATRDEADRKDAAMRRSNGRV